MTPERQDRVVMLPRPRPMRERDLSAAAVDLAQRYGWRVAHFGSVPVIDTLTGEVRYRTPTEYDAKGFPDLVLVHPRQQRVLFRELKAGRGVLDDAQLDWANDLRAAGADWDVWRPTDLQRIERELSNDRRRR